MYPKLKSLKIKQLKCCNFPVTTVTKYHQFTVSRKTHIYYLIAVDIEVQHESYRDENRAGFSGDSKEN